MAKYGKTGWSTPEKGGNLIFFWQNSMVCSIFPECVAKGSCLTMAVWGWSATVSPLPHINPKWLVQNQALLSRKIHPKWLGEHKIPQDQEEWNEPLKLKWGCVLKWWPEVCSEVMQNRRVLRWWLGLCAEVLLLPSTLHFTLHTLHATLHAPHSTIYSPHFTLRTPHSTLYTSLHTPLYTPHSTHSLRAHTHTNTTQHNTEQHNTTRHDTTQFYTTLHYTTHPHTPQSTLRFYTSHSTVPILHPASPHTPHSGVRWYANRGNLQDCCHNLFRKTVLRFYVLCIQVRWLDQVYNGKTHFGWMWSGDLSSSTCRMHQKNVWSVGTTS